MTASRKDLEREADALLATAARQEMAGWAIRSDLEREALIAAEGVRDEALFDYSRWLASRHDPRGALAQLRGEQAAAFVRRHAGELFGCRTRYVKVAAWRWGFAERLSVRSDKLMRRELFSLLGAPALRFLRDLSVPFLDEVDDDNRKIQHARETLQTICDVLQSVPCRDVLETVIVRSVDRAGQPETVLAARLTPPSSHLRPFPRLRDFRVEFDSEL